MSIFGSKNNGSGSASGAGGELAALENRLALSKSRLRPHFINNILSSIYYLCDSDPQMAQSISMAFSGYFMSAITSLDDNGLIRFSQELDMIKNYIALEQLRFENRMNVDYDIYISDFNIPPLTVEPFVENAVKRGVAPKEGRGNITIATRRIADDGVQVKIIDDGVGFNPDSKDLDQHDINNVRERLNREAGAELNIVSEEGKGTEVTITFKPNR